MDLPWTAAKLPGELASLDWKLWKPISDWQRHHQKPCIYIYIYIYIHIHIIYIYYRTLNNKWEYSSDIIGTGIQCYIYIYIYDTYMWEYIYLRGCGKQHLTVHGCVWKWWIFHQFATSTSCSCVFISHVQIILRWLKGNNFNVFIIPLEVSPPSSQYRLLNLCSQRAFHIEKGLHQHSIGLDGGNRSFQEITFWKATRFQHLRCSCIGCCWTWKWNN